MKSILRFNTPRALALITTNFFAVSVAIAADAVSAHTPAEKQFEAWLEIYNRGRQEDLRQFLQEHSTTNLPVADIASSHAGLYRTDGRFDLRSIKASSSNEVTVIVAARPTGFLLQIILGVEDTPAHNIKSLRYSHIETPSELLPRSALTEEEIRSRLDALLTYLIQADAFSGEMLVAKDGRNIYDRVSGVANHSCNMANGPDTSFNVASLSKMFTAVAVAQLVERGKLSYDDTVEKILPDFANREVARKITVHHLLTHSAGLGSKSLGALRRGFRSLSQYQATFDKDPLRFEPGTRYDYSNDGYLLLGAIIEKVSGQSYFSYMREHLFLAAGMTGTDNYELDSDPPNIATGFMDGPDGARRNNIFELPVKGLPFGLGYSTAQDFVRFHMALRNNVLINAKSLETVWTGRVDEGSTGTRYGYGFDVKTYNGTRIVGHSGGWAGVTTQVDMYPDLGYTVVILTNIDDAPRPIAYKLREWLTQGGI